MTNTTAIQALIDAVKAGKLPGGWDNFDCLPVACWGDVRRAYDGSLDAAMALHKAVLPEWLVHDMGNNSKSMGWTVVLASKSGVYSSSHYGMTERQESPARAWLLAVLRAMLTQK